MGMDGNDLVDGAVRITGNQDSTLPFKFKSSPNDSINTVNSFPDRVRATA